jgi:hypothetical protein
MVGLTVLHSLRTDPSLERYNASGCIRAMRPSSRRRSQEYREHGRTRASSSPFSMGRPRRHQSSPMERFTGAEQMWRGSSRNIVRDYRLRLRCAFRPANRRSQRAALARRR